MDFYYYEDIYFAQWKVNNKRRDTASAAILYSNILQQLVCVGKRKRTSIVYTKYIVLLFWLNIT